MKILILMSGGLDSTTLLHSLKRGAFVECVCFDYGQTHSKELIAAKKICESINVRLHKLTLPGVFTDCALVGSKTIPQGESVDNIVPARNLVMLATATAYAIQHDFDAVAYGANLDDLNGFPDCSVDFITSMARTMAKCHTRPIHLMTPFITKNITKRGVVEIARKLCVPIDETWSCYKGGIDHCGECAACKLRNAAISAK